MADLRLIFIVIIASIFYTTIVYSATLRTEDFVETLQQRIAINAKAGKLRIERAIDNHRKNDSDNLSRRNCGKQPCGWAVYVPFIRSIAEFITNECSCPDKSYKCARTDDDLSVSAYVYHCLQNTTTNETLSSEGKINFN